MYYSTTWTPKNTQIEREFDVYAFESRHEWALGFDVAFDPTSAYPDGGITWSFDVSVKFIKWSFGFGFGRIR